MEGAASSRPERNLNQVEVQQTALWRVMVTKFFLVL
jgi:hypothetical protein